MRTVCRVRQCELQYGGRQEILCLCSWSYHTAIWMRSSAFQPGDRDTKLTSRLVPESSFLSVSNPPLPFVFLQAPINLQTVWLLMSLITPWRKRAVRMLMHALLSGPGQVTKAGELGNRYLQTLALSSARDLTKCEAHRASGITAVLGIGFLTAVLSPRAVSFSTCSPWLVHAVGTEAGDQSKTSDTLNKEIDKHIPGRKPKGQRWLDRRVQWG